MTKTPMQSKFKGSQFNNPLSV